MTDHIELRQPDISDRDAFARLIGMAFAVDQNGSRSFVDRLPPQYARVAGTPADACVALLPFGQWFGGRRVECVGVQAVAVAPEARSGHRASALMEATVRELAAQRVALSCLYASTQPLYRRAGYEHAGTRHTITLHLRQLERGRLHDGLGGDGLGGDGLGGDGLGGDGAGADVRSLGADDIVEVQELHRAFVRSGHGGIERDEYQWRRVTEPGGTAAERFGLGRPDLDGYAILQPEQSGDIRELIVLDLAFRTEAAGRRLLALLADFATTIPTATLYGAPTHPLLGLLDQQWFDAKLTDLWMLRIVDVPNAISQRGFVAAGQLEFRLNLDDPLLDDGAGEWVVSVAGRRGFARRATRADDQPMLRCGPRGLATIYSGFRSPREAQLLGMVDGDDEALDLAAAAFASPAPWMADRF